MDFYDIKFEGRTVISKLPEKLAYHLAQGMGEGYYAEAYAGS
jgi:hypothetical protein